jgi:hypothetical protein
MELAVIAGLSIIGSYIINKSNNLNIDPIQNIPKQDDNINLDKIIKRVNIIESNENRNDINYNNGYKDINNVKLYPSDINTKVKHLYDTQITSKINDKFKYIASEQINKSKNPKYTNIIPSLFNQQYQNQLMNNSDALIMGPVPSSELLKTNTESFSDQFNLQTVDNIGEPASIGDTWNSSNRSNILNLERSLAISHGFSPFDNQTSDMTYGIVSNENFSHNNMQPYTSKRDIEQKESNNFEYQMEIFSGSSKNYNPKRETIPFFDPEQFKETQYKQDLVVDEERNRIIQSRNKNNERPFEPVTVSPGLNLDYNEQTQHGLHNTFRVMPKDTNEMRPQNKPKITYEGRIKGAPKKGEKRGIIAPVIKRGPQQWRHQTIDDLVKNKAIVTGPTSQGNYIIPDNARMNTTTETIGQSHGPSLVGSINRAGDVNITKRVTHIEDKLGPKGIEIFNLDQKSYNISNNERNTTNYDENMPAYNPNQGGIKIDENDLAKITKKQQIENFKQIGLHLTTRPKTFDSSDIVKVTNRQELTNKQFNTHNGQNVKREHAYDSSDIVKATNRQELANKQFNTHNGQNIKREHAYDSSDIVKETGRQSLSDIKFNTMFTNLVGTYADLSDQAKMTIKQILSTQSYDQIISASQHNTYVNLPDKAKMTLKQILSMTEFNTNIKSADKQGYTTPQDIANTTIKQILSILETNTILGSANKQPYSNFQDNAKIISRQILSISEFNTIIGQLTSSYSSLTDDAKSTIKEVLSEATLNTQIGSAQTQMYSSLTDETKNTLKQILSLNELNTNIGSKNKQITSSLTDQAKITLKEILSVLELNTQFNSAQKNPHTNLSDQAKSTLKEILSTIEYNNQISSNQKNQYSSITDQAKTTIKELLSIIEFNTNLGQNSKQIYANLSDNAKTTRKETLTNAEFNTFLIQSIGSYNSLSDEAKTTLKQLLSTQELNTLIGSVQKESYSNLSDNAKITLKQILTLETFSNHIKQNIGSYTNISDDIKTTIKELLTVIDSNVHIKSAAQGTYTLMDLAKNTIKEYIATKELNTNIKSNNSLPITHFSDAAKITKNYDTSISKFNNNINTNTKKEIAFDPNDISRTTHKQDLIHANYNGSIINSSIGTQQVSFNIDPTLKDITKIIDYNSAAYSVGINKKPKQIEAARNMRQNITKEVIASGRYPTLSGTKSIPNRDIFNSMEQKIKPNFNVLNSPIMATKINLEDRQTFNIQQVRSKATYDERLYEELLSQFDENPLINNPQKVSGSVF